jgi:hypothetical protein
MVREFSAQQPFDFRHSTMIGNQGVDISAPGIKQGPLAVKNFKKAELPGAIAVSESLKGLLQGGKNLLPEHLNFVPGRFNPLPGIHQGASQLKPGTPFFFLYLQQTGPGSPGPPLIAIKERQGKRDFSYQGIIVGLLKVP